MSNITPEYRLEINAGASCKDRFVWAIGGVPVDLTGATAKSQLRRTVNSAGVVAEFSTENGKLFLGGATGILGYNLAPADTGALSGEGVYDFEVTFADGTVLRAFEGQFIVHPEVTR